MTMLRAGPSEIRNSIHGRGKYVSLFHRSALRFNRSLVFIVFFSSARYISKSDNDVTWKTDLRFTYQSVRRDARQQKVPETRTWSVHHRARLRGLWVFQVVHKLLMNGRFCCSGWQPCVTRNNVGMWFPTEGLNEAETWICKARVRSAA